MKRIGASEVAAGVSPALSDRRRHWIIDAVMLMRTLLAIAVVAARCGGVPASASEANPSDRLERMARAKFGALSHAETVLVRAAPERAIHWAGPSEDPDDPSNDPTHAGKWGPDRSVRAALLEWLCSDPDASRLIHPSGVGIIAARITGTLDLSYLTVPAPITLVRCSIEQGLDLSNAHLKSLELRVDVAGPIQADMAEIGGDVNLTFGHHAAASFYRALIGGSLDLTGSRFAIRGGTAVSAVGASIGGDVLFLQGFETDGMVDLRLAKIGRSLSFKQARFFGTEENGLNAERAVIDGPLYWTQVRHTPRTQLDLEDARATALWDDESSWPAPGNLMVDGFQYSGFEGDSPADAESRLRWLKLQPPGYRPQPYSVLARALRDSGRIDGSLYVQIAQRAAQRTMGGLGPMERAWNAMLQYTIGYGFLPLRALWWIVGFVLLGTGLFTWGYRMRIVTPTDETAYQSFMETGSTPLHYPVFNPFVYSLENFLPIVELHQGEYWRPNPRHRNPDQAHGRLDLAGNLLRWYLWIHILAGWILTPLLAAGLSGLVHVE